LESLRIRTWVQVAPASLPRLEKGTNQFRYKLADKHGLRTLPWMQIPNMGDRKEMDRYWSRPPQDFDPERFQKRLKGEAEMLFRAPPGRKIKWMSLGGFFAAHQDKEASETANEIWYRASDSSNWKQVYSSDVPTWHSHWHYSVDQEVMFPRPEERVQVRYVGDPGLNGIRVNLHSVRPNEVLEESITVTHGYEVDGKLIEKRIRLDGPREYSIDCIEEPKNVFIRMEVDSQ
ncbi:MAG: hypothetical protein ACWGQW_18555, partial [bacterium]